MGQTGVLALDRMGVLVAIAAVVIATSISTRSKQNPGQQASQVRMH